MKKNIEKYVNSKQFCVLFFLLSNVLIIGLEIPYFSDLKQLNMSCEKLNTTELSCKYMCHIENLNESLEGRLIITHSGWAAIVDKNFQKNYVSFELPKRNFDYIVRVGTISKGKYYISKTVLRC